MKGEITMMEPLPYTPDETEVVCPVCGCGCEEIYVGERKVVGCDCCIVKIDAYEWQVEQDDYKIGEYEHFMELKYDEERMR